MLLVQGEALYCTQKSDLPLSDWDPSLITFRWTNETTPVPDYNVQHECRSRDSLLHLISSREIRETPSKAVEGT